MTDRDMNKLEWRKGEGSRIECCQEEVVGVFEWRNEGVQIPGQERCNRCASEGHVKLQGLPTELT